MPGLTASGSTAGNGTGSGSDGLAGLDDLTGAGSDDGTPVVNADGSVSFGANHDLKLSAQNPDGSYTLTEATPTGTHQYKIEVGPDGKLKVTQLPDLPTDGSSVSDLGTLGAGDTADTSSTPSLVTANPDGTYSLGDDKALTISPSDDTSSGGFKLSDTASDGATHDYSVAPPTAGGGGGGGGVGTPQVKDLGASSLSGLQSGVSQSSANEFGSAGGPATSSAHANAATAGSAATSGATPSAGMSAMPMMGAGGAGMGRSGGEELRRRYAAAGTGVIDPDTLDEWDRLGPTLE